MAEAPLPVAEARLPVVGRLWRHEALTWLDLALRWRPHWCAMPLGLLSAIRIHSGEGGLGVSAYYLRAGLCTARVEGIQTATVNGVTSKASMRRRMSGSKPCQVDNSLC